MTPYETIRLIGSNLSKNETTRGVCPWCQGGSTREQSFAVTRDGPTAKYVCHRNSCTYPSSGYLALSGAPTKMKGLKPKPKPKEYHRETRLLGEENYNYIYRRWQLVKEVVDSYRIKEAEANDMLVIPTYNQDGVQQGLELKRGHKYTVSKSYVYHGNTADGLAWFNVRPEYKVPDALLLGAHMKKEFFDNSLLIVEDVMSAIKANAFINTLALMGTSMNAEQAQKIADAGYDKVLIALDADASSKAVKLASRYRTLLPMRVVLLEKDIKDMHYGAVAELISRNHN